MLCHKSQCDTVQTAWKGIQLDKVFFAVLLQVHNHFSCDDTNNIDFDTCDGN